MICVTGMHRSGTSMLCQLLERLGVSFGDPARFYSTDRWNKAGYYEDRHVMDVNSRLITGFARNEGGIARGLSKLRYLTMPRPEAIRRRFPSLERGMRERVESLGDIAVKDPRFCLTLGCWEKVKPMRCVVISYRHPAEVVESLRRRQRVPRPIGYRFWDYHVRQLMEDAPADRTVFVDFNRLGGDDALRQVRPLIRALGLGHDDGQCGQAIESVFDAGLIHCGSPDASGLPAPTERLWSRLIDEAERCRAHWSSPATPVHTDD